ncbi:MAG: UDP-N-acetylglucosamine--N-acetylmuramyl-(pentapeptide) pyrophosphoryl-undecaprenol N-acetylglucosamine transferase [Pseudidiomarina mangrovi]|nr:MAG: UDP-N-acetylglucosamine--N-acetylmuramyl-(pentapeptide) pyrophosphoryl-undecaprenol N-acetylglucosamine transferase [Pseudidiomarina mangrovi]
MNRILIAAAGTGGHVFPALAVAEQLRSYGWQVEWLGTDEGRLESRVVPAAGFSLHSITMQGVRGHGLLRKLLLPLTLFKAFWQCRKLLRAERIQLVLTFGGYVCAPAGLAAKWCGIPLLVHEQNAVVGLTNKLLARLASHVMLGFAAAQQQLPQAEVTGNPLRADWLQALPAPVNAVPKLLIVGGSLGAQALNQAVPQALAQVAGNAAVKKLPLQILHQCGRDRVAEVRAAYQQAGITAVEVVEFIDAMHQAYSEADVVICRAGALTVAELALVGTPAIFVPLPHAVDDHQTANAQALVTVGAAYVLPQAQLLQLQPLLQLLQPLLADADKRAHMRSNAARVARADATAAVVNQCERWANPELSKTGANV